MYLAAFHATLLLSSLADATPLFNRRQGTTTITETATVTVRDTSVAPTTSTQPVVPVISSGIQSLGTITASASAILGSSISSDSDIISTISPTTFSAAASLSSSSPIANISTSPPIPSSSSDAKDPCKEFCKTNNNNEAACLANCQVISGHAQVNAPGKTFPPNGSSVTPSPTSSSVPIVPTFSLEPSLESKSFPEQCIDFCKTDKISQLTCLENCQVIDGHVQVNAPGVVFPPNSPTPSSFTTSMAKADVPRSTGATSAGGKPTVVLQGAVPSANLDDLEKACEVKCEPSSNSATGKTSETPTPAERDLRKVSGQRRPF
ncbi:MAG: hypothetical protein Q9170_004172 [Blastenia crenularia]